MIELRCTGCRRQLSLPESVAGKAIRCAHCRQINEVPALVRPARETRLRNAPNTVAPSPVPRPSSPEHLERPVPRRGSSPLLALLVMGFVGVLLLGVVALIGLGAWWYLSSSPTANTSDAATAETADTSEVNAGGSELGVQTLSRLKKMTVFIKSDFGFASTTGTGFVVRVEDRTGYIVTNDHVARGNPLVEEEDRPGRPAARGTRMQPRSTSVVFDSGTAEERVVVARIIATDEYHDLAILKVTDVANLPTPIDLSRSPELRETLQVYVLGFPLSRLLGGGRNPAITVGKASISSLRYDRSNRLSRVQVQGDINPGNSGGPVVDARGRLVGVAVAAVDGTQIGLAIPPQDVLDLLQHKNYRINVVNVRSNQDEAEVEFQVELLDLVEGVKEVKALYLVGQGLPPEATRAIDGRYPILQNARELVLSADRGRYVGRIKVRNGDLLQNQLPYQIVYTTSNGHTLCNSPQNFRVSSRNVAAAPQPQVNPIPNPTRATPTPRQPSIQPTPPRTEPPIAPPPPFVPPETSITLESPVKQVAVGAAGRFLILHLADSRKLAIFDVKQKSIVKSMPLAEEQVLFAAGKSLLIVALPKAGVFERWNLNTLQKEAEVPSPGIGGIKALAMGSATDDLLLTFIPGGSPNLGVQLIDPKTFRSSPYQIDPIPGQPFGLKYSPDFSCVSMSANAQTIVVRGEFSWSSLVRDGTRYKAFTFGADMPLPSADGKLLIAHGQALSAEGKAFAPKRGGHGRAVWCIPAVQGDYYLSFNEVKPGPGPSYIKLMIHKGSEVEPVATLPKNDLMIELVDWLRGRPRPFERHVFLVPDEKRLIFITPKNDRIDIFPVSLPK